MDRSPQRVRNELVLLLILSVAFLVRLYLAAALPYTGVEKNEYIPLAESISLRGENLHLPVRGPHHPALPAYLIRAGGSLLGNHPLGFRFFGLAAGILMIGIAYRLSFRWAGPVAARWTAVLLAFNEYHIGVSVMSADIIYYYAFAMLAFYFFCRFLQEEAPGYLLASSAMIGLSYLCREISLLLIPVFAACLLSSAHRRWFRRKEPYLALFLFLLVIAPDLYWNFTAKADPRVRLADQLSRIGGIGFTPDYLLFYARDVFRKFGWRYLDGYAEFPTMNMVFGAILAGCVLRETARLRKEDPVRNLMLLAFWTILLFFLLIRPGRNIPQRLGDRQGWLWVDLTLLPASLLAGSCIERLGTRWRVLSYVAMGAGILYAVARVLNAGAAGPFAWENF